jgi:hypothetical protein
VIDRALREVAKPLPTAGAGLIELLASERAALAKVRR